MEEGFHFMFSAKRFQMRLLFIFYALKMSPAQSILIFLASFGDKGEVGNLDL